MFTCESLEAVEAAASNDAHLDWGGARHGGDGVWRLSQLFPLYYAIDLFRLTEKKINIYTKQYFT